MPCWFYRMDTEQWGMGWSDVPGKNSINQHMLTSAVQLQITGSKWGEFIVFLLNCKSSESTLQREALRWFLPSCAFLTWGKAKGKVTEWFCSEQTMGQQTCMEKRFRWWPKPGCLHGCCTQSHSDFLKRSWCQFGKHLICFGKLRSNTLPKKNVYFH